MAPWLPATCKDMNYSHTPNVDIKNATSISPVISARKSTSTQIWIIRCKQDRPVEDV